MVWTALMFQMNTLFVVRVAVPQFLSSQEKWRICSLTRRNVFDIRDSLGWRKGGQVGLHSNEISRGYCPTSGLSLLITDRRLETDSKTSDSVDFQSDDATAKQRTQPSTSDQII
jgi:hypothetical protein